MVKQCVRWFPVVCESVSGEKVAVPIPETINIHYRGTLLSRILSMPEGRSISFEAAINLVNEQLKEAFAAGHIGHGPKQYHWFTDNFVEWITSLGYQIRLSGDEFEPFEMPNKVA